MTDGPYRSSAAAACPRCAQLLLGARGEWLTDDAFGRVMSPRILEQPEAPNAWWKGDPSPPLACVECREPMRVLRRGNASLTRCEAHGLWIDRAARDELERRFSDELRLNREACALADELAAGDRAALRRFVRRMLELERQVRRGAGPA